MQTLRSETVGRAPAPRRFRHPFDSARSTIALGLALTAVLMLLLQLLH